MSKNYVTILLFLFAGMYNLVAQDAAQEAVESASKISTITLKVTPSAEARGVFNFSGGEQKTGNTVDTDGDAEGRIKSEVDYNGIIGAVVELEGDFDTAVGDELELGFGDNAYAYAHVLEAFGLIDKEIFDVYLQGGRFEVGFQNAQYAGGDDWLKDVDPLKRDNRINMQLDFKILDMLTLRTGLSFAPFDDSIYGNDLGFGILFEKGFDSHKVIASLAYVVDSTNNIAKYQGTSGASGASGNNVTSSAKDFDQIALSLAYQGTFGQIVLITFVNARLAGLINKPERNAYVNSQIAWNTGIKFSYKDVGNNYDLVGVGLDFDGIFNRDDNSYYDAANGGANAGNLIKHDSDRQLNKSFEGFQLKVWSDALRSIMGKNYLKGWVKFRFETWVPEKAAFGVATEEARRESFFKEFGIGVEQYFVNKSNASVSLFAEFSLENVAPFTKDAAGFGYFNNDLTAATTNIAASLEFGLKASFTGIFMQDIE